MSRIAVLQCLTPVGMSVFNMVNTKAATGIGGVISRISDTDRVPIDDSALERLRRLGGEPLLAKMIELFSSHVQLVLTEAFASLKAGEVESVERAVHSIKSSAGHLGAWELRELAEKAEQTAHDRNVSELGGLLSDIEEAFHRARTRLQEERT